jgi:hypothetical protein
LCCYYTMSERVYKRAGLLIPSEETVHLYIVLAIRFFTVH